jgi:hypothetical protein
MNQTDHPSLKKKTWSMLPSYSDSVCCGVAPAEEQTPFTGLDQGFVTGFVTTSIGKLPQVISKLDWRDHWGAIKARWGVDRMDYSIDPGLYALGNPNCASPVLVTANYKMSFDKLRNSLFGKDVWILVLDTKGINVWCAAGKGTFGTDELVKRIETSGLKGIVSHRSLVLPQLGAPGVAAHTVKKRSGFVVHYGPVEAKDLPAYMNAGFKATRDMRLKTFLLKERAVLIPIELVETIKPTLIIAPLLFLLGGIGGPSGFWTNVLHNGTFAALAFLSAVAGGAIVNPILLPYLPGRAFSTKGLWLGAVIAATLLFLKEFDLTMWAGRLGSLAWLLIIPAVTAYLAMNFTGASTYTSLSGVNKEMRWALPLEIGMVGGGFLIWIASRLIA